jgi:hypothetical protein
MLAGDCKLSGHALHFFFAANLYLAQWLGEDLVHNKDWADRQDICSGVYADRVGGIYRAPHNLCAVWAGPVRRLRFFFSVSFIYLIFCFPG